MDETRDMIQEAGPVDAVFDSKTPYVDQMSEWSDPFCQAVAASLPAEMKPSDFVTSLDIAARKAVTK